MILLKSFGVGLLCVCALIVTSPILAGFAVSRLPSPKDGGVWGWDMAAFIKSPSAWVLLATIFAVGSALEYRHLTR